MLIRSLRRVPPSLLLLLVFLAFFGWQLSQGPNHEFLPTSAPTPADTDTRPPRIAIVTFVTEQRSYLYLSLKNKDRKLSFPSALSKQLSHAALIDYARRHGYDFIVDYEAHTDRATIYWKFNMIEKLIKADKYDWIWWIDFDTLFTNTDIKITDIIEESLRNVTNPDEIDMLITNDCNRFNAGSFVLRGQDRAFNFMRDAWKMDDEYKAKGESISEQDALRHLMDEEPGKSKVIVLPQWKMNAFPEEIGCFDDEKRGWEDGMFVIHFAGAWAHVKGEDPTGQLMKKYEGHIRWGDWKQFY
ncbi:hypothetical protein N0V83_004096 [Neocucurbitaria cava]|uniref:Uncharacterized protein n=1 Tax=Neocucurbitaria cava TaxID=798079 RepID=A0A9W9CMZ6_9PLEO|nr:hypothetical protein N0V83_004096 [Neocucurbitaria cava]